MNTKTIIDDMEKSKEDYNFNQYYSLRNKLSKICDEFDKQQHLIQQLRELIDYLNWKPK